MGGDDDDDDDDNLFLIEIVKNNDSFFSQLDTRKTVQIAIDLLVPSCKSKLCF